MYKSKGRDGDYKFAFPPFGLAKARKAKRLERTFEVPIPDGIYDRLTEEIQCAEQSAKEAADHGE